MSETTQPHNTQPPARPVRQHGQGSVRRSAPGSSSSTPQSHRSPRRSDQTHSPRKQADHGRRSFSPRSAAVVHTKPKEVEDENAVKFTPLGGFEEIGRNCSFFEYKNQIIIIDVGIQFPEENTPGVDYIIPNVTYLEQNKEKVQAIILTHGHYDHMAAIHYVIEKLGNPIIYTSKFTRMMVEKRHEEFTNAPKLRFITVEPGQKVKLSADFTAEFFEVEHTIPESLGLILETPVGNMVNFGDFRLDLDKHGNVRNKDIFEMLRTRGVHTAFMDSTNADTPGKGSSEETIIENLEMLIKEAKGRVIVAAFASLVDRILEVIAVAEKLGRKVTLNGRSMKTNLEIAKQLGYLKERKDLIIPLEDINKYKDEKILLLTTGTQGEANAGLMRIVNGEHRVVTLKPTDTVIFSSSVIPGNERSVQFLTDNIARQVDQVYNSKILDIHVGGHAHHEDAKFVVETMKPKFIVPIHGYYFKRKSYEKIAQATGMKKDQVILMDNGQVLSLTKDSGKILDRVVPSYYVMVDGLGVGDVEEVVLRDRRALAQEGMVVVVITIDRRHGKLLKSPDIISRGFIYLKDNQPLLEEMRKKVRNLIARIPANQPIDSEYVKSIVRDQMGQFIYQKTHRRPMILPVVIEI